MAEKRIPENAIVADYKDGQILQYGDMNAIVDIFKTAINANYDDIKNLEDGATEIGNAATLNGLSATTYTEGPLEDDDTKVPSEKKVKQYTDQLVETTRPIRGVDYWTEVDKKEIVDEAVNEVDTKATSRFNVNYAAKLEEFNIAAEDKKDEEIASIESNANDQLNIYNANAQNKLDIFNNNYEEKLDDLNKHQYLPATDTTLGAVIIGDGIDLQEDGTISVDAIEEVKPVTGNIEDIKTESKTLVGAINELKDGAATTKEIVIGDESEASEQTKILIEDDLTYGMPSEVVDSFEGNEHFKSPSVASLKEHTLSVGTTLDEHDEEVVLLEPKNICDVSSYLYVGNSLGNDGELTIYSIRATIYKLPIKPNTTYTISTNMNIGGNLFFYNKDKTHLTTQSGSWTKQRTFTSPSNAYYLSFATKTDDEKSAPSKEATQIQIEEGTTATTYEPCTPSTIYANGEKYTDTLNIGTEPNNSGLWVDFANNLLKTAEWVNGYVETNGEIVSANNNMATNNFISVSPNTQYILSANQSMRALSIAYYNGNTFISRDLGTSNVSSNTFTTPNNCNQVKVWVNKDNSTTMTTQLISSLNVQLKENITPSIKVNNNGVYETIANKNVYSTSEVVVGEYMGKPLYRKLVQTKTPTTTDDVALYTISSFDNVVKLDGYIINVGQVIPINFYYNATYNSVSYIQNGAIHLKVTSDYRNKDLYLILEYTKTTD